MTTSTKKSVYVAIALALVIQMFPVSQSNTASAATPGSFWGAGEMKIGAAEEVVEAKELTVQEALLSVCEANGYGEDCAKTLLGMLWTESSNRATVIGDSGRARGYYQIHYRLHNISTDCAEDIICSSQWTIDYLERNHYPRYVNYAVQCHNSCNAGNGYVNKVIRYGNYFWNQPLEITTGSPV